MTDTPPSTQPGTILQALVTQLQTLEQTLQAALTPTNGTTEVSPRLPPAERHRRWALEQDLLTDRAFREGYEVLQPSRWMHRFWPNLLRLNAALQRLEANSFTQLGGGNTVYAEHARALYQRLADYRAFTHDLTRQAENLARGRFASDTPRQPTTRQLPPRSDAQTDAAPSTPVSTPEAEAAALAVALTGLVALGTVSLLPELWPSTTAVLSAWTLWRLGCLGTTWRQQVRWRRAPTWQLSSTDVPLTETSTRLPPPLRRWLLHRGWLADPGLLLGRAFRWTAHHTQALELALARDGALPVADDARGGHPALHAVGSRHERPLVLPWSELVGHVLVAGTTRSGKTRCLELLAAEAIRAPGAVVILDPKGDSDLLARCAWEAERQGRPFVLFSPAFPTVSATFNPLETAATASEVATRIQALMPGGGEKRGDPFFTEYPLAVIERVAAAQATLGQRWTLEGLEAPSVLRPRMEALLLAYLQHHLGPSTGRTDLQGLITAYQRCTPADPIADALIDDLQKPRDHFQKVTANLIPAFRGVTGAPLGPLLSTLPADLTWDRVPDRQMVVYFALASLLLGGGGQPHRPGHSPGPHRLPRQALCL